MFRKATVVGLALFLFGCGGSALLIDPMGEPIPVTGVKVTTGGHTATVSDDMVDHLRAAIERGLYGKHTYSQSGELVVNVKFLQQDENLVGRWFGRMVGRDSVTVAVTYINTSGKVLAQTQVQERVDGSFFDGGAFEEALDQVAARIVSYTASKFPQAKSE